jgi:hypothetical protein
MLKIVLIVFAAVFCLALLGALVDEIALGVRRRRLAEEERRRQRERSRR